MTVDDLTAEHIGWEIRVTDPDPLIGARRFVLVGHRKWTHQGITTVGLVDPTEARRPFTGTERHYPPETTCELIRQVKQPRRARRP